MAASAPLVSICVPVFNGERWIERAVRSGLQQTYPDFEVVVVDNASTDRTREVVQSIDDPRLRLFANSRNLGLCGNFNRSAAVARGRYVKYLFADDALYPDCLEAMLPVFESDPQVGLVFAPREIELEDPGDPVASAWKAKHERTHTRFGDLQEVNSGDALLARWVEEEFRSNWIGEPTNVMLSRQAMARVGGFNIRMRVQTDMDLWARVMLFYSVGFVDRPLSSFLVHAESRSGFDRKTSHAWLDRLWLFEGLLTYDEARRRHPELRRLRAKALLAAIRDASQARRTPTEGKLRDFGRYLGVRLFGRRNRSRIYGTIEDKGGSGETVEIRSALVEG